MNDDVISRQAAIKACRKTKWNGTDDYLPLSARDIESEIRALPSVQPSSGWICPVCGRGLSPFTSVCPCNNGKGWEITC